MHSISVETARESYKIYLGADLLLSTQAVQAAASVVSGLKCMIVGDVNTVGLYRERLERTLTAAGAAAVVAYSFEPGETSKQLATVETLYHEAVRAQMERSSVVIALGGGVAGDVAGFFAATYLRGVPFVQVPTSLLAMVDSSVGGKVGVDLPEGKNLVGAFYQPQLVLTDISALDTLPERERRCGLAEIVKTAVLFDPDLFRLLEKEAQNGISALRPAVYEEIIARCCEWKSAIVREDEKESGRRAVLNYGHTFGHAVETLSGYTRYNHGEAVAIGMAMAADMAVRSGVCPSGLSARQDRLLTLLGLPTVWRNPSCTSTEVVEAMYRDKKVRSSCLRLILPTDIGKVEIREVNDHDVLAKAIEGRLG